MISNAHALDPTLISAPAAPRVRPLVEALFLAAFWLGVVGWWAVLALSTVQAWLSG